MGARNLTDSATRRYLARIGLNEAPPVDVHGLETLQRAHLTSVPFENLDIYARRGVETGLDRSVPKIVEGHRGGWCFELNGAFSGLLAALGFEVRRLGATVLLPGALSEPSHLTLEVTLEFPFLVDVGFGDTFIKPLRLDLEGPQDGGSGEFAFVADGEDKTLFQVGGDGSLVPQYRFGPTEWGLQDFDVASERLQMETGSYWTRARFVTRLLAGGPDRVTLLKDRIKFRRNGVWSEQPITAHDWPGELERWFEMIP